MLLTTNCCCLLLVIVCAIPLETSDETAWLLSTIARLLELAIVELDEEMIELETSRQPTADCGCSARAALLLLPLVQLLCVLLLQQLELPDCAAANSAWSAAAPDSPCCWWLCVARGVSRSESWVGVSCCGADDEATMPCNSLWVSFFEAEKRMLPPPPPTRCCCCCFLLVALQPLPPLVIEDNDCDCCRLAAASADWGSAGSPGTRCWGCSNWTDGAGAGVACLLPRRPLSVYLKPWKKFFCDFLPADAEC